MKVKVSAEFFDRRGRIRDEVEAVELSRDIIRMFRDSEWYYAGYLTIYNRNEVTSMYFDDTMPIETLNNLLEMVEMEVSVNA